jgi:predicted HicB family RNase H-like nuclease
MKTKKEGEWTYLLHGNTELHDKIRKSAIEADVSMAKWIIRALKRQLEAESKQNADVVN